MLSPTDSRVLNLLDVLPPYSEADVFTVTSRLRGEGWEPEVVTVALTQARLRQAATSKFGDRASHMLFLADALEQASRPDAARHHAKIFHKAGVTTLREVGSGIGADTLVFAQQGLMITARELDSDRAEIARYNLREFPNVTVEVADGLADVTEDGFWADPARRGPKGRINNPEEWGPPLSHVLNAARESRVAGIKVAPGIEYTSLPSDSTVEWLSSKGDLIEAIIWLGIGEPGRVATMLDGPRLHVPGDPSQPSDMVDPGALGTYIYEPDPAVIRAGGIAHLCNEHDLTPVAPGIAYLTGNTLIDSPFLQGFTVEDVLPLQEKKLAKELAQRNIGRVEIKKRGVDIIPETLRKKLKLSGSQSATLILTPLSSGRKAVLATRHIHP